MRLKTVFQRFREGNLRLSPTKCQFLQTSVKYLGHIISKDGVATDPQKIDKVKNWPTPNCQEELQSFLGLCNYYRKFIPNYSHISKPMWKAVTRKPFNWSREAEDAFVKLKTHLSSTPILALPTNNGKYILDTDASHGCIGAVLSQIQDGTEKVIAYASNKLSKCQHKYCVTRKELLAAYIYIIQFKHYLMGKKFLLRTDHKALLWLLDWKKPSTSQYCLWKSELEAYDFEIQHRKGENHGNADGMSRYGVCGQCELKHSDPKRKRNVKLLDNNTIEIASVEEEKVMNIFSHHDKFSHTQQQDDEIRTTMTLMKLKRLHEVTPIELKHHGYRLWKHRDKLRIRGDMLYYHHKEYYRLIVPQADIKEIISSYHDKLGHMGQEKCIDLVRQRFFLVFT